MFNIIKFCQASALHSLIVYSEMSFEKDPWTNKLSLIVYPWYLEKIDEHIFLLSKFCF